MTRRRITAPPRLATVAAGLVGMLCAGPASAGEFVDCNYDGIELKGRVEIVDAFADIRIEVVDAFADIDVQRVEVFPDACGKWQIVDAFADFSVEIVDAFPDISVRWVDTFPGIP